MIRRNRRTKIPVDPLHRERTVMLDLMALASSVDQFPYGTSYAGSGEDGHAFLLLKAEWGKPMRTYRVLVKEVG